MQQLKYLYLSIVLLPTALHAGQVYGSVTSAGSGVAKTGVEINCGGATTNGTTAGDGSFRINVPQQGQCLLTLPTYPGRPSAVVFSYPNPSQYDFELARRPDGNYELRRR
jgi:hypothetical protein